MPSGKDAAPRRDGLDRADVGPMRVALHLMAARSALEIPRVKAVAELLVSELESAGKQSMRRHKGKAHR